MFYSVTGSKLDDVTALSTLRVDRTPILYTPKPSSRGKSPGLHIGTVEELGVLSPVLVAVTVPHRFFHPSNLAVGVGG